MLYMSTPRQSGVRTLNVSGDRLKSKKTTGSHVESCRYIVRFDSDCLFFFT